MELRYTKEIGKAGDPDYIRQRVLRSKDGSYYLIEDESHIGATIYISVAALEQAKRAA